MAETADGAEQAEWTVMFYICGSDLESRYGYATENLLDMAGCRSFEYFVSDGGEAPAQESDSPHPKVNVVLETGGSSAWQKTDKLGIEIMPNRLQRWSFLPLEDHRAEEPRFTLQEELASASMAAPETLADFIRWSAKNYPAKKYALVLWGHGGGSKTGVLIDELYGGDTLLLDELQGALGDGGVQLEALLFDACMMAGLETACAVKNNARWMIASEEEVAGRGTAVGDWLQQLYLTPRWDGNRLGRWICELTQRKYAERGDTQALEMMTWSVIDLAQIEQVESCFDEFFQAYGRLYTGNPYVMAYSAINLREGTRFGLGDSDMYDLAGIFYQPEILLLMDDTMYESMLDALQNAVEYNIHGPARSGAHGLSFCLATNFSAEEMDIYARNCPSAHYLALLDAILPEWEAPDGIYETVERLPDIREIEGYQIQVEKGISASGVPGVYVSGGGEGWDVYAKLLRLNEETGRVINLGYIRANAGSSPEEVAGRILTRALSDVPPVFFSVKEFWMWPAIEGIFCCAEVVEHADSVWYNSMYNIPIQLGSNTSLLRCGYDQAGEEYQIYGIWQGYDADSGLFDRNVIQLSQVAGQEFNLLYPIDATNPDGKTLYEISAPMDFKRSLELSEKTLPAGTYYLEYSVEDMFLRKLTVDRAEIYWDGEKVSVPEGSWEGALTLLAP